MKNSGFSILSALLLAFAFRVIGVRSQNSAGKKANFSNNLATCFSIKDVNECLKETLEELRSLMPVGIPELGLAPTEPLNIDNMQFQTKGLVSVNSQFSNVVVRGLSSFQTNSISADLNGRTLELSMTVPRMNINGLYNVRGQVFVFPFQGDGDFTAVLHGVKGIGRAEIVPVGPKGDQKLSVRHTNIDFDIADAQVQMNNLFGGKQPTLAREVNKFINGNTDLIMNEVKPQVKSRMIELVETVMNDAFSKIKADDFIETLANQQPPAGPQAQRGGRFLPPPRGPRGPPPPRGFRG